MVEQLSQKAGTVSLRPSTTEDEQFLFEVYASTRMDELDAIGMDKAQEEIFLNMQYMLQRQFYRTHFTQSSYDIILLDGIPAGRFIVNRTEEEIRGVDIALLPEYRSLGIGSYLILQLQEESNLSGKPFRFQVEKSNHRAFRLYQRLGFIKTGEIGMHYQMEWQPRGASA